MAGLESWRSRLAKGSRFLAATIVLWGGLVCCLGFGFDDDIYIISCVCIWAMAVSSSRSVFWVLELGNGLVFNVGR